MYEVAFLMPDGVSNGTWLSIETLMDASPAAINPYFDCVDGYLDAQLYVCCGKPEKPPERYACLFWDDIELPVNKESRRFLENSIMTLYASPEQLRRKKAKWVGTAWGCDPLAMPPLVDPDVYYDEGGPRHGAMWVGRYRPLKGLRNTIDWARESGKTLDIHGIGRPFLWLRDFIEQPSRWWETDGVRVHDHVPDLQMPKIFNRHQSLASFPQWFDPCPRACIEAAMCGCKVLTNEENGFASWGYSAERWEAEMRALPDLFWRELLRRAAGHG